MRARENTQLLVRKSVYLTSLRSPLRWFHPVTDHSIGAERARTVRSGVNSA
jgi:hypothetical protein